MACAWFVEICSCVLNNSKNKFHQTTYKPYFRALYSLRTRACSLAHVYVAGSIEEAALHVTYGISIKTH